MDRSIGHKSSILRVNKGRYYLFKRKYNIRATRLLREQISLLQSTEFGTVLTDSDIASISIECTKGDFIWNNASFIRIFFSLQDFHRNELSQ